MGGTAVRLLSSLCLLVIIVQAQDCSRPVGGPNMDLKGNDILLNVFPDGKKVTFACNPGYVTQGGSPSITCTSGNWSLLRLTCERRSCGAAEEVEHGHIDYQPGNEFGDKAVVICNTGYLPVGKGMLTCGVQGWEGRLPVCEVVECESPPEVVDGSFSPNKLTYAYNEVVQYTCKRDYILNGSKQLACSDDGTFKPDPPKCIIVKCTEPEIPNGFWSSGARPPYGYLSTVTFECNPGYRMNGSATQRCEINSQWVPGLPKCIEQPKTTTPTTTTTTTPPTPSTPGIPTVAEECQDPKRINSQVTVSRNPPYRRSDQVTVSCPSGDKQGRQFIVTCRENGLWIPEIPKCETVAKECPDPKRINSQVTVSRNPPYRRSDQVTVSCPSGDKQGRQFIVMCRENGLWVPEIPKCETEDSGSDVVTPLLITLAVLAVLIILGLMYYFGVPPFSRKRKGARRGNTDKMATNEGEDVALS